jgi:UDP-N-acetylglucosamine 2-epimerase (non-hydrolysing)
VRTVYGTTCEHPRLRPMLRAMPIARIVEIAAARPNFMKVAPIHRVAAASRVLEPILIHTGQHYDPFMTDVFFADLGLSAPEVSLEVGPGTHAEQTARVLERLEPHLLRIRPTAVVVVGDVNSTLAAALCAVKLHIPVAHVEAGLRSSDRDMPEEINRIVTDAVSDVLLAPSDDAVDNLRREGQPEGRIHMVGNVMIDSLELVLPRTRTSGILDRLGLERGSYFVATLHRPSNVDDRGRLDRLVAILVEVAQRKPLIFVAHPRTMALLDEDHRDALMRGGVTLIEALGYVDFLALEASSAAVLTDSGGVQEETTVLGVPCLTLRNSTERPVTVTAGTNHVVGLDGRAIIGVIEDICAGRRFDPVRPRLWDGRTSQRIVRILERRYADGGGHRANGIDEVGP